MERLRRRGLRGALRDAEGQRLVEQRGGEDEEEPRRPLKRRSIDNWHAITLGRGDHVHLHGGVSSRAIAAVLIVKWPLSGSEIPLLSSVNTHATVHVRASNTASTWGDGDCARAGGTGLPVLWVWSRAL